MARSTGIFLSAAMARPRTRTETAIPISTEKKGTPIMPRIPPTSIKPTKVAGIVQMARPPICALSMPTLSMARRWSSPRTGWVKPLENPNVPWLVWAKREVGSMSRERIGQNLFIREV